MKVTKDLILYLEHIDTLSKKLPVKQQKELENILTVILGLLVALKRDSRLGRFFFTWVITKGEEILTEMPKTRKK